MLRLGVQQLADELIGQEKAPGGEAPAVVHLLGEAQAHITLEQRFQGREGGPVAPLVFPGLDAPGGAQAQHHVFHGLFHRRHRLLLADQVFPRFHRPDIALHILQEGEALAADTGGGGGAEARVVLQQPVFQVVAGGIAPLCEVGDLILDVARPRQGVHGVKVHVRLEVVVGDVGGIAVLPEGSALLDLQAVAAQVLHVQLHDPPEGVAPVLPALGGEPVDQVQADVLEARPPGLFHRPGHLGPVVPPPQEAEDGVVGALGPQGDAVEARPAQAPQPGGLHAVGVGLQGDLAVGGEARFLPDEAQQVHQVIRPVPAGGAPAEIHRVDAVAFQPGGGLRQVLFQRLLVGGDQVPAARRGAEVAVGAAAGAEGDMDIEPQLPASPFVSAHVRASFSVSEGIIA